MSLLYVPSSPSADVLLLNDVRELLSGALGLVVEIELTYSV